MPHRTVEELNLQRSARGVPAFPRKVIDLGNELASAHRSVMKPDDNVADWKKVTDAKDNLINYMLKLYDEILQLKADLEKAQAASKGAAEILTSRKDAMDHSIFQKVANGPNAYWLGVPDPACQHDGGGTTCVGTELITVCPNCPGEVHCDAPTPRGIISGT